MTDQVRDNIVKSFRIALMENKGDAEGMQLAITSIGPHASGKHDICGKLPKIHKIQRHIGANIFREETVVKEMV